MAHEDTTLHQHPREYVVWGSRLTPEEREWQITKLLPAILMTLENAADAANAHAAAEEAAKQAAE